MVLVFICPARGVTIARGPVVCVARSADGNNKKGLSSEIRDGSTALVLSLTFASQKYVFVWLDLKARNI